MEQNEVEKRKLKEFFWKKAFIKANLLQKSNYCYVNLNYFSFKFVIIVTLSFYS